MTTRRLNKPANFIYGIAAGAFAIAVFSTDSIEGLFPTTGNPGTAKAMAAPSPAKNPFAKAATCDVHVISYFDDASLERINKTFGDMMKWMTARRLDDVAAVVEHVFGEAEEFSSREEMLMGDFSEMMKITKRYKPGTKEGLAYLKKSPQNVIDTGLTFIAGVRAMQDMVIERERMDFSKKFGKEISRINKALLTTQDMLITEEERGCQKMKKAPVQKPENMKEERPQKTFAGETRLAFNI